MFLLGASSKHAKAWFFKLFQAILVVFNCVLNFCSTFIWTSNSSLLEFLMCRKFQFGSFWPTLEFLDNFKKLRKILNCWKFQFGSFSVNLEFLLGRKYQTDRFLALFVKTGKYSIWLYRFNFVSSVAANLANCLFLA